MAHETDNTAILCFVRLCDQQKKEIPLRLKTAIHLSGQKGDESEWKPQTKRRNSLSASVSITFAAEYKPLLIRFIL